MAKAEVKIICKKCGNRFTWSNIYHSRKDADAAEIWAKQNITLCPECRKKEYIKEQQALAPEYAKKAAEILSDYKLPVLTGTEKQIAYATSLRDKFIANDIRAKKYFTAYNKCKQMPDSKFAEKGTTKEEELARLAKNLQIEELLNSDSAGEIIEFCKH